MDLGACSHLNRSISPLVARYVYGAMFLITCFIAWAIRDFGFNALSELERLKICQGAEDCVGADGVLRVSLGCFIFFFVMFVSTVGSKKLSGTRDVMHSGWWPAKIFLWIAFMIIPFFLPFSLIQVYGETAHYGAGVFLLIQLVSIISFIRCVDDYFRSDEHDCHILGMVVTTVSFLLCIPGIIFMYVWYVSNSSCLVNIALITGTLIILTLMIPMHMHPKVNSGFLTLSLMGLYMCFLCWSAIRSEPPERRCDRHANDGKNTDWLTIVSFLIALLAMVFATFTTGIDSQCFQLENEVKDDDDVPYGYGFFHIVFATASMYLAMLLVSWNANLNMRKWTIDVGWTSTYVRIVNEVVAFFVYAWMVLYPIFWKDI